MQVITVRHRVFGGMAGTAGAVALALALAACSSSKSASPISAATTSAATVSESPAAAASSATGAGAGGSVASGSAASGAAGSLSSELPDAIRSAGVINFGTSTAFPPYDFTTASSDTIIGFEPDLRAALGNLLGVKLTASVFKFPELVPGIQAKRFDAAQDGISDTADREKVVDFVDYAVGGAGVILVLTKNSAGVSGYNSLCGKTLGSPQGTEGGITPAQINTICEKAGLPDVKDIVFPDAPSIQLALKAGRVDFQLEDGPTGGYDAKTSNGQITAVPIPGTADPTKMGIVVPKGSTQLEKALQDAFNVLIKNGTYQQILNKWGVGTIAVPSSTINSAASS
jgi:polar amino acid transport system substrate-binding protein